MTTQTRHLPVSVDAVWPFARRTIERRAMRLKRATGLKLPLAATRVMERDPALFRITSARCSRGIRQSSSRRNASAIRRANGHGKRSNVPGDASSPRASAR